MDKALLSYVESMNQAFWLSRILLFPLLDVEQPPMETQMPL